MTRSELHAAFVDYVALLYHEARNIRHLVRRPMALRA